MSRPRTAQEALQAEVESLGKRRDDLTARMKAAMSEQQAHLNKAGEAEQRALDLEDERSVVVEQIKARERALIGLRAIDTDAAVNAPAGGDQA